jgi:GTP cyclohydrolase IB
LIDIQGTPDERGLAIDNVGVSGLRYPIVVLDRRREKQHTIATMTMSVGLPHHQKGTHMSRFLEVLNEGRGELTIRTLPTLLQHVKEKLEAETARVVAEFPYFLEKAAPVSGAKGLMDYDCTFTGEIKEGKLDFVLKVAVPVTSLCPCSKAISDYGAHNQRGIVEIEVRSATDAKGEAALIWIEELVEVAEQSGSAPVYPLLKRPDERHVTMQAYDNPVFVEDMVRNAGTRLRQNELISWFRVKATNEESIHNHAAFAELSWDRKERRAE